MMTIGVTGILAIALVWAVGWIGAFAIGFRIGLIGRVGLPSVLPEKEPQRKVKFRI